MANLDIGRKIAEIPVEERMTILPSENTGKGKSKHTGKGKGKHVDVVETEQPQPSETVSAVSVSFEGSECYWRTLVHFKREPVDHGCDNQFRVIHKETTWCPVFAS